MAANLELAREMAQKARKWAATPEGQEAIREAVRKAEETCRQLAERRKINNQDLHEPFTI